MKENKIFMAIILVLIAIFFLTALGITGLRTIAGTILLFILPTYLILNNFDLSAQEKIVFAFFIGIGIFPSIVYLLGLVISLRAAMAITFILLVVIAFVVRKYKGKKESFK
ncbi:hypothetical protein J4204_03220 [Candidatus Woesearchaeota archaeon]|nr:hypothetical protein [Candidatus Woesearchaeota archaeon]